MHDEIKAVLSEMGYHDKWIAYGLVSEELLAASAAQRQREGGGDEHYRYGSFLSILHDREQLSDADVSRYVELVELDPDAGMAGSALRMLIEWCGLSDGQFTRISRHPWCEKAWLNKAIRRAVLIRAARRDDMASVMWDRCLTEGDGLVHQMLLGHPGLTRDRLLRLKERGANRTVRNVANSLLRSRKRPLD